MYKRGFFILLLFSLMIYSSYSTQVDVNAYVYRDYTIFNYVFKFDTNDTFNKFSIEKPRDAKISYAVDKNGPIKYEATENFFIFNPEDIEDNVFLIKYKSEGISKDLFQTDSFRTYLTFNFPVDELKFTLELKDDFGEIIDIFPSDYRFDEVENEIVWNYTDVPRESLFIVNFKEIQIIEGGEEDFSVIDYLYEIGIILVAIAFLVLSIVYGYGSFKRRDNENKTHAELKHKKREDVSDNSEKVEDQDSKEDFEEIIEKHLTENERDVVLLVKDNEGISQFDILNYLPQLTKSNLSKIISKLHSRKILKRIKVGKVNKIYLGDRIKK